MEGVVGSIPIASTNFNFFVQDGRGSMDQRSRSSLNGSEKGFWFFIGWSLFCVSFYLYKIPSHPIHSIQNLWLSFQYSVWTGSQIVGTWIDHGLVLISFAMTLLVFLGTG